MVYRVFTDNRRAYAVHRASLALDWLIAAITPEQMREAVRLARAWYVFGRRYRNTAAFVSVKRDVTKATGTVDCSAI